MISFSVASNDDGSVEPLVPAIRRHDYTSENSGFAGAETPDQRSSLHTIHDIN